MRAGLIEVVSQAARITSATDRRLEQVFGNIPKFRAASFKPAEDTGPSLEVRAEVSEWLATISGESHSLDLHELAVAGRNTFGELRQPCTEARSTLSGAGLAVPEVLTTMDELLGRVMSTDDELVVTTLHERRADLADGREATTGIAALVADQIGTLRAAKAAIATAGQLSEDDASSWAEELQELLDRARYAEDLARIKTVTTKVETSAQNEENGLRAAIASQVENAIERLRSRYPTIDDDTFTEAIEGIRALPEASGLALLRANADAVAGVVQKAADNFDVLSTTKEVRHVRVSDIWGGPITADNLPTALERIRERVLAELDDDTEVRFR